MAEEKVIDIEELIQDDHNFNRGTEAGQKLMEESFSEHGAGRSILVDKNGKIIAGNKSQKAAIAAGIKKVRIIETTGDELIAVKRTDVDLDSKEGREMALQDNLTTQVNLAWDETELQTVMDEVEGFDPEQFGLSPEDLPQPFGYTNTPPNGEESAEGQNECPEDNSNKLDNYNIVYNLVFNNEGEQNVWFKFLRKLKEKYVDLETISERVVEFIKTSEIWQE